VQAASNVRDTPTIIVTVVDALAVDALGEHADADDADADDDASPA